MFYGLQDIHMQMQLLANMPYNPILVSLRAAAPGQKKSIRSLELYGRVIRFIDDHIDLGIIIALSLPWS